MDELVRHPRHRRDDDCHLVPGVDFALDPPGNIFNPVDIGERGAAKFLNYATHVLLGRTSPGGEPLQDAFATRTAPISPAQPHSFFGRLSSTQSSIPERSG